MDRRKFHAIAIGAVASVMTVTNPLRQASATEAKLSTLRDGHLTLPIGFALPDASPAELSRVLGSTAVASGSFEPPCNVTLLRVGSRLVLFDAGSGPNFQPTTGRLSDSMVSANVNPVDVTDVVFTHAHPDHLWGVVDDFDEVAFPEATFHIAEAEWKFWRSEDALAAMPEDRKSFVAGARTRFDAMGDRLVPFAPGAEVIKDVEAFATPGHTPGHTSFIVHSGGDTTVIVGDALSNDPVSFAQPDWKWAADHDPDLGVATRVRLLDRLVNDKARLIGFHLPGDGSGFAERQGSSYRFVPST